MKTPMSTNRKRICLLFSAWLLCAGAGTTLVFGNPTQPNGNNITADRTITGKITAEKDGSTLPGVNILVKGTTIGSSTDANGNYSIGVGDGTGQVLIVSYIGYTSQELAVGNSSVIDVVLKESAETLNEVVVTALGISKDKRSLGYATTSLNAKDLEVAGTGNALKSLDGKTTGVQINSLSSNPTSSVMFNIRGASSLAGIMKGNSDATTNINNATQPLIVLNGVPLSANTVGTTSGIDVGNFMNTINPSDIESVSILKGASASALYGSSAGNGVILITTKSGAGAKRGLGVSINSATSFDMAYSAPPVQRQFFQGGEEGEPITDDKKGLGWAVNDTKNNVDPVWRWDLANQKWEKHILEARGDKNPLLAFLKTGIMLDNNVAVTGNYDKGNYRLNVGNMNYTGVIPSNKTIRTNVSFDGQYKVNKNITVTSQASYSRTFSPNQSHIQDKREDNPLAHAMSMPINMPKMSEWESANTWLTDWTGTYQNTPYLTNPGEPRLNRVNAAGFDKAVGKNGPYFAAENVIRTFAKDNIFGKVQLDWKLFEPLRMTLRTGMNSETFNFERKTPWGSERAEKGGYEQANNNSLTVNTDALLMFNKTFLNDELSVDLLGGFSYKFNEANKSSFGGSELATPNSFTFASLPAAVRQAAVFERGYSTRSYGAYATATLGWRSTVYLELSGRNDWVGILNSEKASHFYPGASLSWIASETFKFGPVVNLLKLRGSYSQTGYGIGHPVNLDKYAIGASWGTAPMGTISGDLVDSNIKPELNVTQELGLDFKALNSRVNGEFTVYSKDHKNQIQNLPVVGSSGFNSVLTNMGSVVSKGVELSLRFVPIRTKDWEVGVGGNFSTFNAKIKELDSRFAEKLYDYDGNSRLSLFKGSRVGDLYSRNPIPYIQSGKYKGMMLTGMDGIIGSSVTTTDHIRKYGYLGNMNPKAIMGFNADAKYKNFKINVVTSLRVGGVFISETQKIMVDDGMADIKKLYPDKYDEYFTGGRFAGGLPSMPNPNAMFTEGGYGDFKEAMQNIMTMYNGDPRYFGYWNAVFIDPNYNMSNLTGDEKLNLPDAAYIKNGADPTKTIYLNPYAMEGNELWAGTQFRTFDATSFKIKEINFTYQFDRALAQKLKLQDVSITLFAKNVMFWAKNTMNEDPETAFFNGARGMGVANFGLPPMRTMGVRLAVSF